MHFPTQQTSPLAAVFYWHEEDSYVILRHGLGRLLSGMSIRVARGWEEGCDVRRLVTHQHCLVRLQSHGATQEFCGGMMSIVNGSGDDGGTFERGLWLGDVRGCLADKNVGKARAAMTVSERLGTTTGQHTFRLRTAEGFAVSHVPRQCRLNSQAVMTNRSGEIVSC